MEELDDGERRRRAPPGVFAKAGAVATGGLDDGERAPSVVSANAADAAADGLPQRAAAWRRSSGSGGQLTGRTFTMRGDRTRSWTPGDEAGGAQDSAATSGAVAAAVAANTFQMMFSSYLANYEFMILLQSGAG